MCMDELCVPMCDRWNMVDSEYCKNKKIEAKVSAPERCQTSYIESSADRLYVLLMNGIGFGAQSVSDQAKACADGLTKTTGTSHHVDVSCDVVSDQSWGDAICYYKVVEGRR